MVATEHLRGDRRSRAQMQEFANLTAELLVGQQGHQVQLEGMRLNVKVEKPEQYDGNKTKDLDTWLFSSARTSGVIDYASERTRSIRCVFVMRQCSSVVEGGL